jgi:ABC-type nitrate/sulfonate/bicarbonate transport system permease component
MQVQTRAVITDATFPSQLWKWGLRCGSLFVLATIWELGAHAADSLLIPTFTETMWAFVDLLFLWETWQAIWRSNQALVGGFLLSLLVGIPLGLFMGSFDRLGRIADIYLNVLLVVPAAAMIPLVILATGLGLLSRVLIVFVFAFVVVAVNTQAGVRQVDSVLIDMARSFGASRRQTWRWVLVPGAAPAIAAGVRLGLGRAIAGMVIVELLLIAVGFGSLILRFQGRFDSARVYAVILMVVVEALLLMGAIRWLEKRLVRWQASGLDR